MSKKASGHREVALTRKQVSRREKETRTRRLYVIGTAVVLGLVVLIIGWGLYDQYVLRPRKPVAIVAGVPIRLETYQNLVKYRRWDYRNYLSRLQEQKQQLAASSEDQSFLVQYIDQQIQQIQSELVNIPTSTLDEMIDDQLVRQECARRGITVSTEEVQLKLEQQFGYDRNPPTPMPTPITSTEVITTTPEPTIAPVTTAQYGERSASWFQAMSTASGFTEQGFRTLLEGSLYRQKLETILTSEVITTSEQVHARHILVQTKEEADAVLTRLNNGEAFAKVAADVSQDTSNKDDGGDLGWFPRGQMVTEFDDAVFALQPGQTSQAVQTQFGFHIIRVDEREANRPLDANALQNAQQQAISDWFTKQRAAQEVVRKWDSTMVPPDRSATGSSG
jgi:parvulin-like peptidyl-prolyl isomerase